MVVELIAHRRTDVDFCPAEGLLYDHTVTLEEPLGGRVVMDATSGEPVARRDEKHPERGDDPNGQRRDRSLRPHRSPSRTSPRGRREVIRLREKGRWGADRIAHATGPHY